jgi:hypothetical protein
MPSRSYTCLPDGEEAVLATQATLNPRALSIDAKIALAADLHSGLHQA